MADLIQNIELYHDRTVQDWHRYTFPPAHKALDLDLFGFCQFCRETVYMVESTTNPNKATSVLRALAARASVPAAVVLHSDGEVTSGWVIHPAYAKLADGQAVYEQLVSWRYEHMAAKHPHIERYKWDGRRPT